MKGYHLIQVSLDIAFLQVNLLVGLDYLLQPLLSLFTLLELKQRERNLTVSLDGEFQFLLN